MRPVMLASPMRYGYTWCNMYLLLIWYITRNRFLAKVLWCNSCGIVVSYECGRLVCTESLRRLRLRLRGLDTSAHYLPIALLYGTRPAPVHALVSAGMHLLWGYTHNFDMNAVYKLTPPVTVAQSRTMWACAVMGHIAACVRTTPSSL